MNLVFLGAPGAGKGTQAAIVAKELGLAHIATGDLFRDAVKNGTELGKIAKTYMEKGALLPDVIVIKVIAERLKDPDCRKGVIFDGFPRTLEQAKALDTYFKEQKNKVDHVVYIEVKEDDLIIRLGGRWTCQQCQAPYHEVASPPKKQGICDKCGGKLYQRPDDNITTIKERLKVYFSQTMPLLDYYKKAGNLLPIDGAVDIKDVSRQIIKSVGK